MRIYKREMQSINVLKGGTCDICKKELDFDNLDNFIHIGHTFGYGTKYDGKSLDIDICDSCLITGYFEYIK